MIWYPTWVYPLEIPCLYISMEKANPYISEIGLLLTNWKFTFSTKNAPLWIWNRFLVKKLKIQFFDFKKQKSTQKHIFRLKWPADFFSVKTSTIFFWKTKLYRWKNGWYFWSKNDEFLENSLNSLKEAKPQKKFSPAALFEDTHGV